MNHNDPANKLAQEIIERTKEDVETAFNTIDGLERRLRKAEHKLYYAMSGFQILIYVAITFIHLSTNSPADKAVKYIHWITVTLISFFGLLFWQVYRLVNILHEKNRNKRVR